jgi:hypothetical protein
MKKWAILAAFFPSLALAEPVPGGAGIDLFRECQPANATCYYYLLGFAEGFSNGQADGHVMTYLDVIGKLGNDAAKKIKQMGDKSLNRICMPDAIQAEQMRLVFMKWAGDHPEKLNLGRNENVEDAFAAAFPCPK